MQSPETEIGIVPEARHDPELGRTIDVAGIRTNYHDLGSGSPLLMIHGSGPGVSAWANWRMNLVALAARRRVIAPDCLGFGHTDRPADAAYSRARWLDHLIGLLDALALDRVDIVGNSFGGGLALALAQRHPERVGRLVLMGSIGIGFAITPGLEAVWGYVPSTANMRRLLEIFAFDTRLAGEDLAEKRYRASILPGAQEAFAAMFPPPRQRSVDAFALSDAELERIPHPTLILHGREDRVIPPGNAHRLFALLPDAELHMFGRCGHWTQIEHADAFNRIVDDFLARGANAEATATPGAKAVD